LYKFAPAEAPNFGMFQHFISLAMKTLLAQPRIDTSATTLRAYQGGYFEVLVAPDKTDGSFALLDMQLPRGAEPPRHVHTREDETFYLLEGNITFHIGDEVIHAQAGQTVFAPRQVPHHFHIESEAVRFLTLITPGQFAEHFLQSSVPVAARGPLTPPQGPPPAEVIQALTRQLQHEFGVLFN
jgi:quercetin dioxygenase-like cupin family protein